MDDDFLAVIRCDGVGGSVDRLDGASVDFKVGITAFGLAKEIAINISVPEQAVPDKADFGLGGVVEVGNGIHFIGELNEGLEVNRRQGCYNLLVRVLCDGNRADADAGELLLFGLQEHGWDPWHFISFEEIRNYVFGELRQ